MSSDLLSGTEPPSRVSPSFFTRHCQRVSELGKPVVDRGPRGVVRPVGRTDETNRVLGLHRPGHPIEGPRRGPVPPFTNEPILRYIRRAYAPQCSTLPARPPNLRPLRSLHPLRLFGLRFVARFLGVLPLSSYGSFVNSPSPLL